MDFTLRSYLSNPYGKGSTIVPNLQGIKEGYMAKLSKISEQIIIRWFNLKNKSLICYLGIPSESVSGVHYDVVFEFDLSSNEKATTALDLQVQVFSNSPSFSYTYAYAFMKADLVPKWLHDKYTKEVRKTSAAVKNSNQIIGLEKTIYMAALYLTMNGRADLATVSNTAEKITSTSTVKKLVMKQNEVETKYRNTKKLLQEQKKKEKALEKNPPSEKATSKKDAIQNVKRTGTSSKVTRAHSSSKTKKSKKI